MKHIAFTLLLLAGIAGKAQMKGDTTAVYTRCWPKKADTVQQDSNLIFTHAGTGSGWIWSSITVWERYPGDKYLYDSGRVEIRGDTIAEIRRLMKQFDSTTRKYWDLQEYTQGIVDAVYGLRGTQNQIERYWAAVRRYKEFVYGVSKKKRRKG